MVINGHEGRVFVHIFHDLHLPALNRGSYLGLHRLLAEYEIQSRQDILLQLSHLPTYHGCLHGVIVIPTLSLRNDAMPSLGIQCGVQESNPRTTDS